MSEQLQVTRRATRGKRQARKARAQGQIPAVLYGHGKEVISVSVSADEVAAALRHGARVVKLSGEVADEAMISQVQWDAMGTEVLHLDLIRVEAGDSVHVSVPVVLRGDAPGAHHGGVVQHLLHEVRIDCPVTLLPESLVVSINKLDIHQAITAQQLALPAGAQLLVDPTAIVVQCVPPVDDEAEAAAAGETAEPEVIGRKAKEEEESEE